jgi:hypothetical protein
MRWVGALAAAAVATGCLLPQDDQVLKDFPIANNAPYFTGAGTTSPEFNGKVNVGENCKFKEFTVQVDDPDDDVLEVRCFLDPTSVPASGTLFEGERKPSDAEPPVQAYCRLPVSNLTGLGAPGSHFVKMVVADGRMHGETSEPRTVMLGDGGTLGVPTYTATFLWAVTSENQPCLDGGL